MDEIAPGLLFWTTPHPEHGHPGSSYWLREAGVVLNPLLPTDDTSRRELVQSDIKHVLLTNRLHRRHAFEFRDATVHVPEPGLHAYDEGTVEGFKDGDDLPGDITARQIGGMGEDEFALVIPSFEAVAVADGVIRNGDGPLQFVPNSLMGTDEEAVDIKRGLLEGFGKLLEEVEFDLLLLAHGHPVVGDAHEELRKWIERESSPA